MDSNYKAYDHSASFARIDGILATPKGNYEEVKELPGRDRLTFVNGFYAYCSAVFVDIRDSSSLPDKYNRPALAKLYRAYISEVVAILNSSARTREVNIVGDGVWAVFNTPQKVDINEVFDLVAKVNSLMRVLNFKLAKAGYKDPISAGVGVSYGRALMIKAGYSGSGINDVVYMGDVVNHAAKLAAKGNLTYSSPSTYLGNVFAGNLNEHNTKLIAKDWTNDCYTANVINTAMNDWYEANCK
ncbi:adenylate/guanylate cyclase domain-containing protein [Nocardioides sp. dk4132]|uniref:adenylate/guanylate cyclase domain-containing protein n=1 Tax=unclassified Nocardioides TaxID=2615069 RepID=UPI001294A72D|nr:MULTISPECIES: adenylate/guanylate cyclase domain-containing protein [unclassified Nocardioides]MQW78181.1 adenylate/guanylate cyclase domain-containing protein [Nocardioides sp. dk4132]QGA07153.1 adenylate/guanylate cyclase domain-containing protein [Nocardioides sp. dk884]